MPPTAQARMSARAIPKVKVEPAIAAKELSKTADDLWYSAQKPENVVSCSS